MKLLKVGALAGLAYFSQNPIPLLIGEKALGDNKDSKDENSDADTIDYPNINLSDLLNSTKTSVQTIRSFRADFQKLIEKTKLKALIILIDDLDRCSPDRLIENLEAIKLFLNVKNTAFIVATDRRIVENAIRIRYSELFNSEKGAATGDSLITDYLEKLIQVPYPLPKLAPHEVRSYLFMLFLSKYMPEAVFNEVLKHHSEYLSKERYAAFHLESNFFSKIDEPNRKMISESMRLVESCSDAITDGLKGNPRQIKRFLNAFWLRRELARIANLRHLKDYILIKLMVLEYISNDRFDELYQWHRSSTDGTAQPLSELETADGAESIPEKFSKWGTPRIWRWVKAEPGLKAEDLRDYFWVSRSAISDTFAGVRLMTQAMRTCAEEMISNVEVERKNGVIMFESLSEDEQEGVLGIVMRQAMQDVKEDAPLRSLIDLAGKGQMNAADTFFKCVERIGVNSLTPGFGITLRTFKIENENRASELVGKVIETLKKSDTQVGRALQGKRKRNK